MSDLNWTPSTLNEALLLVYGLSPVGMTEKEVTECSFQILQQKGTAKIVAEVWKSSRYPYSIMLTAAKIGMYIPPSHRWGSLTFDFFLKNIRWYEPTFNRKGKIPPTPEELFLAKDRLGLLMQFRDDEILRNGAKWDLNYKDRKAMLEKFIEENVTFRGEFSIESNSRSSYSPYSRIILYSQKGLRLAFNIEELGKAIDTERRSVWKSNNEFFDILSLVQLRKCILEKFGQWKDRVGYVDGPNDLITLVHKFDEILSGNLTDISAYLSSPA